MGKADGVKTAPPKTTTKPRIKAGRSLLLSQRGKATAQVRWTGTSSWTPALQDSRRRTSQEQTGLASMLLDDDVATCAFVDVTPLATSEEWVRRATDEFISIASFNRFSLDLLRFGAPANLVSAAQKVRVSVRV